MQVITTESTLFHEVLTRNIAEKCCTHVSNHRSMYAAHMCLITAACMLHTCV